MRWCLTVRVLAAALLTAVGPDMAAAQQADMSEARVDSARALWRRALAEYRAHDASAAVRDASGAYDAWPWQPSYARGLARMAAAAGDTAGVARWLEVYAAYGLSFDLSDDSALRAMAASPAVSRAAARLAKNRRPFVRSRIAFRGGARDFFPEGLACTPDGRCYLGSVSGRTIVRTGGDGETAVLVPAGRDGLESPLGLGLSPDARVLWAASAPLPYAGTRPAGAAASAGAAVFAFTLPSGRTMRRLTAPRDTVAAVPGDLLVARDGDVFVSDARRGVVYRVPQAGDTLEVFARSPLLRSPQGIAESEDGMRLYVADYANGLLVVDRATRAVHLLPLPAGATSVGIDALVRHDAELVGVQNGVAPPRVVGLRLGAGGGSIVSVRLLDRHLPIADAPTSASLAGSQLVYVANSLWEQYDDHGTLRPGAALRAPVLLRLPLN